MPHFIQALTHSILIALASTQLIASSSLTIYNKGFGVVRETVPVELEKGSNTVEFTGVTSSVETDSVIFRDPTEKLDFTILEQNYRNDPLSIQSLMKKFEGQVIRFEREVNGQFEFIEGKIISAGGRSAITTDRYGQRQIKNAGQVIEVGDEWVFTLPGTPRFPKLDDGTLLKPTLQWNIFSPSAAKMDAELSYISEGFGWKADYSIIAPEDSDTVSINGWVTLNNQSGATFEDTQIKLVAGEISKVKRKDHNRRNYSMASMAVEYDTTAEIMPTVKQKSFDEYHLYTLPTRLAFYDGEQKQVELMSATGVESKRIYVYNGMKIDPNHRRQYSYSGRANTTREYGVETNKKVWVMREIENKEENGLGMSLPAGIVRFYRRDADDGQIEFTGENLISHTPKNETLMVYTGESFDLVGERKRTDFDYNSNRKYIRETFEIKLRNHKDKSVEIRAVERLWRWSNWEMVEHSSTFMEQDSNTIEFRVQVMPDEEKVITYTVLYTW